MSALSAHRFLLRSTLSAVNTFVWIFVLQAYLAGGYSLPEAFVHTLLAYSLVQVVTIFATPYASQSLVRGTRRLAIFGVVALAAAYTVLGATVAGVYTNVGVGVLAFAAALGLYRALYVVPYNVERARVLPTQTFPGEFFIACMPAIAGLALQHDAPVVLLSAGALMVLLSTVPLTHVPEVPERFSWKYRETFGELLEPRYRKPVAISLLLGFEAGALLVLWPQVIYIFIAHNFALFGMLITAALLIAIPLRQYAKTFLATRAGLILPLVATAWIFRIFTATPAGVVVVDAYSWIGQHNREGVDMYSREQYADNAQYVDEVTALKEMCYALGRLFLALTVAGCIIVLTLPIALTMAFMGAALCAVYAMQVSANESTWL